MSRYLIRETHGYPTSRGGGSRHDPWGATVLVLDSLYCHRPVGAYRSEDYYRGRDRSLDLARRDAAALIARLEAGSNP